MIDLSVAVMAHPDRAAAVGELCGQLGWPASVAWDDEGAPSRDHNRIWRTARRAWGLAEPGSDWHLVLQDDALPCPGMLGVLSSALAHVPARSVVSLYVGARRPLALEWERLTAQADERGAAWIVGPRILWGVALAIPTKDVPRMLAAADRWHGLPDDMRVGKWATRERYEAWYPWPSLVDHSDAPSLVGHGAGRVARRVVDTAAAWDPAGPVVRHRIR